MKRNIHPTYYHDAKVICACGNTFVTGSVLKEIKVEICSACHPFFTGEKRLVDTEGRVDRFLRKQKAAQKAKAKASKKSPSPKTPKAAKKKTKSKKG